MKNKKQIICAAFILSLLATASTATTFATQNSQDVFIDEKGNITPWSQQLEGKLDKTAINHAHEINSTLPNINDLSLIRNVNGKMETSNDYGKSWGVVADDGFYHVDDTLVWKTLTVEDLKKSIAECKDEMKDKEFMKMMLELNDFTKNDMENLIKNYEQQIEDIKNGAIIKTGTSKDGSVLIANNIEKDPVNIMFATAVGAVFVDDETGSSFQYETKNLEQLKVRLEKAVKDGEITKENMDKVILEIENNRNMSANFEAVPTDLTKYGDFDEFTTLFDEMKNYEEFGVTFESSHSYLGNIYYNGELIKSLSDIKPNGSTLFVSSKDGGEIELQTIYDTKDNLIGVKKI